MNKQFKRYLQFSLSILDLLILNVSFIISKYLFVISLDSPRFMSAYMKFWVTMNVAWILLSLLTGNYGEKIIIHFESFTKRTLQVYILWVIVLFFLPLLFQRSSCPGSSFFPSSYCLPSACLSTASSMWASGSISEKKNT